MTVLLAIAFTLPCESRALEQIAPTGDAVAVRCTDGTLQIVEIPSGKLRAKLPRREVPRSGWAWSPDGKRFAVAFVDGRLEIGGGPSWRASDRHIDALRFLPDGRLLAAPPGSRRAATTRAWSRPLRWPSWATARGWPSAAPTAA